MRADGASSNTLRARLGTVLAAARHVGTSPESLTSDDLDTFLAQPHLVQNTRASYYQHISAWFDFLVEEEIFDVHPLTKRRRKRPKLQRGIPRPLTDSEVDVVMETSPARYRDLMMLGLQQGVRVSEAVRIRGEDFRSDQQVIVGKGGVTRLVPIHADIQVMRSRKPRVGLWFPSPVLAGRPISKERVSTDVGLHFRNCGIPVGSFHRLRHTYATRLHRRGVPTRTIQVLLGHASLSSTQIYTQVEWDDMIEAVALLPRVSGL